MSQWVGASLGDRITTRPLSPASRPLLGELSEGGRAVCAGGGIVVKAGLCGASSPSPGRQCSFQNLTHAPPPARQPDTGAKVRRPPLLPRPTRMQPTPALRRLPFPSFPPPLPTFSSLSLPLPLHPPLLSFLFPLHSFSHLSSISLNFLAFSPLSLLYFTSFPFLFLVLLFSSHFLLPPRC